MATGVGAVGRAVVVNVSPATGTGIETGTRAPTRTGDPTETGIETLTGVTTKTSIEPGTGATAEKSIDSWATTWAAKFKGAMTRLFSPKNEDTSQNSVHTTRQDTRGR